jgi:hypothetical protein
LKKRWAADYNKSRKDELVQQKQADELVKQQQQQQQEALQQQAAGQGISAAGQQLNQGVEASIAAQQAAMAGGRFNPAAMRNAQNQAANMQQQANIQAAQTRTQEQLNAQQTLGQVSNQFQQNENQFVLAQQDAKTKVDQLNQNRDQVIADSKLKYLQLGLTAEQAQIQAQQDFQKLFLQATDSLNQANLQRANQTITVQGQQLGADQFKIQQRTDAYNRDVAAANAERAEKSALIKGVLTGAARIGAAAATGGASEAGMAAAGAAGAMGSDKRLKKDVKPIKSKDTNELLDKLAPKYFGYKNPEVEGQGQRVGVMAQDLEKSKVGKTMVQEDETGTKRIDLGNAFGTLVALQKDINDRLKKLEDSSDKNKRRK